MRNFIITLIFLSVIYAIADSVLANTLCDLYSDNTGKQTTIKTTPLNTNPTNYNGNYMPNYSNQNTMKTLSGNANELMKKGSQNYGEYASANKRTNPVRIDNPYNHLNDKYIETPAQAVKYSTKSNEEAVRFKKGADGNIYGYNKYGQKVGIFKPNNNGTTSQYDLSGNKTRLIK